MKQQPGMIQFLPETEAERVLVEKCKALDGFNAFYIIGTLEKVFETFTHEEIALFYSMWEHDRFISGH